jgi:hypothetical protein
VNYWPLRGTMLILMAESSKCGERGSRSGVWGAEVDQIASEPMDLYSYVMPSALRDAADAMDRALSGGR